MCQFITITLPKETNLDQVSSDIKRKKKKGWSDAKVNRWIEQKENSGRNEILKQDNQRWRQFLYELLIMDQISKVGVLIHWYDLGLEDEPIKLKGLERIKISNLDEETLENMEYDTLYEFVK